MDEEISIELLHRWRDGDEAAANDLFDRYVNRLCGLARAQLSNRMQRRVEPEDVVQSVYRSFFRRADDQFTLEKEGDLWRLLAAITINKVRGAVEFHTAQKRGVYAEESLAADQSILRFSPQAVADEPTPGDAAAMVEELEFVMSTVEPVHRQILELSMQNQSIPEIAQSVQRSERTVRRGLQEVREMLKQRLLRSIEKSS